MNAKLHYADSLQQYNNCIYNHEIEITDIETLKQAVSHDYVCAKYKNNYRSIDNFISANCIGVDIDNDHSDKEDEWITPEVIKQTFIDVPFMIHYSKSHLKEKGNKSKRPRFHVIFIIDEVTNKEDYQKIKNDLYDFFPYIDNKAMDVARFLAGTNNPEVEIYEGNITLNKYLENINQFANLGEEILEGNRNNHMHTFAVRLFKRYGKSEETKNKFLEEASKCNPPLETQELKTIYLSAYKFYQRQIATSSNYIEPDKYNLTNNDLIWDEPIKFDKPDLPKFPIEALPKCVGDYVLAVSETTQTPVDMAGTCALAVLATCIQKSYKIKGKADWYEPLNLYTLIIAKPSERKSAVINLMTKPINELEIEINDFRHDDIELSRSQKSSLERKKISAEQKHAKGKITNEELKLAVKEYNDFTELKPVKLYVDDITTEKLTSVLAECDGYASIISSEGGFFNILAGQYNKNVNIDVVLKAYSGDTIRVDRIGRPSETIKNASLSILLTIQPSVLNEVIKNNIFDGRGFTARFLYTMPESLVGKRKFDTNPIPDDVKDAYKAKIKELLQESLDADKPEIITLTPEAKKSLETFYYEVEKAFITNQEIQAWLGKLVGNVLRLSGIIARTNTKKARNDFLTTIEVNKNDMDNAIKLGKYYTKHAKASYSLMGIDIVNKQAETVLDSIIKLGLTEFTKRDVLRHCRSFKTVEELTPAINRLAQYGYIQIKEFKKNNYPIYAVNPCLYN